MNHLYTHCVSNSTQHLENLSDQDKAIDYIYNKLTIYGDTIVNRILKSHEKGYTKTSIYRFDKRTEVSKFSFSYLLYKCGLYTKLKAYYHPFKLYVRKFDVGLKTEYSLLFADWKIEDPQKRTTEESTPTATLDPVQEHDTEQDELANMTESIILDKPKRWSDV
jgi:hypothetical protein